MKIGHKFFLVVGSSMFRSWVGVWLGFPDGSVIKNPPANVGDAGSIPGSGRSPGVENDNTPIFLPGKFHGQRSLVSYSPRDHRVRHD